MTGQSRMEILHGGNKLMPYNAMNGFVVRAKKENLKIGNTNIILALIYFTDGYPATKD